MAKKKKRGSASTPATHPNSARPKSTKGTHPKSAKKSRQIDLREYTTEGKIAWWTLLVLVFLVPIAISMGPLGSLGLTLNDGFDGVKILFLRIGVVIALVAWLWDIAKNGGEIRYHKVYIVLAALLVWIGITTILSVSPATAFFGKYKRYDGFWSYLICAALFFLTVQYATSFARAKQMAEALSWSSVIVAGYGLLQYIGLDPINWGTLPFEPNRSFSTYGNPDLLAGFLAFGVFVNLGLALSEKRPNWRAWFWCVFLANAAVVITAFSRSIWVASFVAFALFAFLAFRQKLRLEKTDLAFSGGVVVLVGAIIVRSLFSDHYVMNFWARLKSIFDFGEGSAITRFQIWGAAGRAIRERPIFGYGSDTFRLIFRRFAPPEYAQAAGYRSVADNVHNFPLQLAAGIGIVGALLFYVVIGWIIVLAAQTCFKSRAEESGRRILFVGILSSCVAYLVHLVFGLSLPGATFLLWMFLGVLLIPHTKKVYVRPPAWAWMVALGATLLLCVTPYSPVFFAGRLAAADIYYREPLAFIESGRMVDSPEEIPAALETMGVAVKYNPFLEIYLSNYVILSTRSALLAVHNNEPDAQEKIARAEELCERLLKLSPWEYDSYLAVGSFYLDLGKVIGGETGRAYAEKSAQIVATQIEETPTGLALRNIYADVLLALGQFDQAREQLEFCVAHDSNFVQAAKTLQQVNEDPSQFQVLH